MDRSISNGVGFVSWQIEFYTNLSCTPLNFPLELSIFKALRVWKWHDRNRAGLLAEPRSFQNNLSIFPWISIRIFRGGKLSGRGNAKRIWQNWNAYKTRLTIQLIPTDRFSPFPQTDASNSKCRTTQNGENFDFTRGNFQTRNRDLFLGPTGLRSFRSINCTQEKCQRQDALFEKRMTLTRIIGINLTLPSPYLPFLVLLPVSPSSSFLLSSVHKSVVKDSRLVFQVSNLHRQRPIRAEISNHGYFHCWRNRFFFCKVQSAKLFYLFIEF